MNNSRHLAIVAVLIVVATLLLRVFFGWLFTLPVAASTQAGPIDGFFSIHFWMISFLFALIMVLMLYSAVAFRRRPDDHEDGPHIHSNTALEIGWTVIPTVIVLGFGVYGAILLNNLIAPQQGEITIQVEARQWGWKFTYPEHDNLVSGQLALEIGQPIVLELSSVDVLHSFWVPEFRMKQDLVPGRTTTLRLEPTKEGSYKVRCAEICGTGHADMRAEVLVMEPAAYAAWIEEASNVPVYAELEPAERGQLWYSDPNLNCVACHSADGTALAGPTWQAIIGRQEALADGSSVVIDADYIRNSVLDPNAQIVAGFQPNVMPQNLADTIGEIEQNILDTQGTEVDIINDLIAFMETLQ
ncbi:MAG: cytochrome c oxidase subunit II [Chloroflexota bacterium]